jgi:putative ABC transport system ATP-binding protein
MGDLSIQNLTVEYASGADTVRPIDGLSLDVAAGSLVILMGPSGCGKTTLLSCLGGILRPTAGAIKFGDVDVTSLDARGLSTYRRDTVGIVFQAFNLVPSLSAIENVMVPLSAADISRRAAHKRAGQLLARVGLQDRMSHRPGDLSGGQQQRVAVARAIALDPPLVLADEPTAHLDFIQQPVTGWWSSRPTTAGFCRWPIASSSLCRSSRRRTGPPTRCTYRRARSCSNRARWAI